MLSPLRNVVILLLGQLAARAGLRLSDFQLGARHHYSNRHLALPAARQCSRGKLCYRESPNNVTHLAAQVSFLIDLHCLRRVRPFDGSEVDSGLERGCRASNFEGQSSKYPSLFQKVSGMAPSAIPQRSQALMTLIESMMKTELPSHGHPRTSC